MHQAADAGQATTVLATTDIDVVLTDIRMDGAADGRALLDAIKDAVARHRSRAHHRVRHHRRRGATPSRLAPTTT